MLVQFEIGHHLDAGDQGRGNAPRQGHGVPQNPINAVADCHVFFRGLNVDVRGGLQDRVAQKGVGDPHDRQVLGHLFQLLRLLRRAHRLRGERQCPYSFRLEQIPEFRLQRLLVLPERFLKGLRGGEARQDAHAFFFTNEVNGLEVVRIKHRNFQLVLMAPVGNDIVGSGQRLRDQRQHLGTDGLAREIYKGNAQNIRLQALDLLLFH